MRIISSSIGAAAALLILLSAGCASRPVVRIDQDPKADLRGYKTFAFFAPVTRGGPGYTTLQTQHLQRATREQMERQGYVYDDAHPDLRVNVVLHLAEKMELRSAPGAYGYRGWGGGVESGSYRQGTLAIDLVDARRNALVWQGVAEGRVKPQAGKDPGPAIEAAVAEVFAGFASGQEK